MPLSSAPHALKEQPRGWGRFGLSGSYNQYPVEADSRLPMLGCSKGRKVSN